VVPFIVMCKMVLTFESVNGKLIFECDNSNKTFEQCFYHLNNRVLLSKVLSCEKLPEEI